MTRALAVVVLVGCTNAPDDGPPTATVCSAAEDRVGHRVCVHSVPDDTTWAAITFPAKAIDQRRVTTFLVPARAGARVPTVFIDASGFTTPDRSLHHKFLTTAFPELVQLEYAEYLERVLDGARREWFAGSVTEYLRPNVGPIFGFTVWDGEVPSVDCAALEGVFAELEDRFSVGPLAWVPATDQQRSALGACDVPIHDSARSLEYEVYTQARGCGTIRHFSLRELSAAEAEVGFGWQDLLVIDEAPLDLETIVAGIVTGTRQGELSHLNVRSAGRGTPNCYVRDADDLLARWQGELVALTCGIDGAQIEPINPAAAQACWDAGRPDPISVPPADLAWAEPAGLQTVDTETHEARRAAVARFGAKGANLASLYQRIDREIRLKGFLLPAGLSTTFMAEHGFDARVAAHLDDPRFLTDGAYRRRALASLRDDIRDAPCDPALEATVGAWIDQTFGDTVMVRFRSSSNAEDALGFSGAGLYDSTSVCLADTRDDDEDGPSQCDPEQRKERTVCRGLLEVWASVWNMKAFEERAWYGIDHRDVAMGVLVNTRTPDEEANIVAFTGNPLRQGDGRFLINAQAGELDVVAAEAGVWPEKTLLTVVDGAVTLIERLRGSTELPEGAWVLSDAQLRTLGGHLATITEIWPVDAEVAPTETVLLDTEWKLRRGGRLAIKQIRPFVR